MADKLLDVKNLACPLPVLKARKALQEIPRGGTLEVLATDLGAPADFEELCRATGSVLIEQSSEAGTFRFVIQRGA